MMVLSAEEKLAAALAELERLKEENASLKNRLKDTEPTANQDVSTQDDSSQNVRPRSSDDVPDDDDVSVIEIVPAPEHSYCTPCTETSPLKITEIRTLKDDSNKTPTTLQPNQSISTRKSVTVVHVKTKSASQNVTPSTSGKSTCSYEDCANEAKSAYIIRLDKQIQGKLCFMHCAALNITPDGE